MMGCHGDEDDEMTGYESTLKEKCPDGEHSAEYFWDNTRLSIKIEQ